MGDNSEDEYEVEEIVDDKVVDGVQYYLIKWKDYAPKWNSWEPVDHLACPELAAAYYAQKKATLVRGLYAVGFDMALLYDCPPLHRIRVINTVDNEELAVGFTYTDSYVRSADIPEPSPVVFPCTCAAGGRCGAGCECMAAPYYDEDGLLRTDHPGPIYECNEQCPCSADCPNRVVQRGKEIKIDIIRTVAKGWGAATRKAIRKGEFVCRYTGELLSFAEAEKRYSLDTTYLFDLDKEVPSDQQPPYTVDARMYGNVSRFFNHSCEPNMAIRAMYIGHLDPLLHELAFFALRDIAVGEELTFDYHPQPAARAGGGLPEGSESRFRCQCGARTCRHFIFY
ncbi:hypothetical protein IWQ56_000360 [Coemansia nantahalensis]|uniref:Uncharacterized protein n=2 Tax=Coemansia TaxID=4863 RepID=A0ACC1KKS3_9FUNG|nr:hypothetical protein IWQ57_006295 [Coemansia nantahalensis]KAJ2774919.1 hypothetical protein IWQ56_000360 [Coemansia nantahalensis]KAJ2790983.1 hypothetical protein H4R21_006403 [Coemansia helicoidea]